MPIVHFISVGNRDTASSDTTLGSIIFYYTLYIMVCYRANDVCMTGMSCNDDIVYCHIASLEDIFSIGGLM